MTIKAEKLQRSDSFHLQRELGDLKWHLFVTFRGPAVNTIIAQTPGEGQRLCQRKLSTNLGRIFFANPQVTSWLRIPHFREPLGKMRRWWGSYISSLNWTLEVKINYHQVIYSTWRFLWLSGPQPELQLVGEDHPWRQRNRKKNRDSKILVWKGRLQKPKWEYMYIR